MSDEKIEKCCYCKIKIDKVEYRIHRDGIVEGPELPLCVSCGSTGDPSLEQIWAWLRLEQKRKQELYWKEK